MIKKYSDRRHPRPAAIAFLSLSAILIALAPSCARKSSDAAAPARDEPQAAAAAQEAIQSAARSASAIAQDSAAQRPPTPADRIGRASPADQAPTSAPALAANLRAFGLGARVEPRMPRDFSLGLLQGRRGLSGAEAAVLAVVDAFMTGLAAGKIDPSLFLPEARDALSVLIAPLSSKEGARLAQARAGAIEVEGGAASLRVRLPAEEKAPRLEGLLSLREKGGAWYVEALALDPPSDSSPAFEPGSLR